MRMARCVCGATEEVKARKDDNGHVEFWRAECGKCGRQTAKHTTMAGAVAEWAAETEDARHGREGSDD